MKKFILPVFAVALLASCGGGNSTSKEICGLKTDFVEAVEAKEWDEAKELMDKINDFQGYYKDGEKKEGSFEKEYDKMRATKDDKGEEYKEEGAAEFLQSVAIANANCDCLYDLSYRKAVKAYNKHEQEEKK